MTDAEKAALKAKKQRIREIERMIASEEVRAELEARVVGYESVTVPAGTFQALKIVMTGPYRGRNPEFNWLGRIEDTLWYSPIVRNAVRYEYRDTVGTGTHNHEIHELVRFWLAP